MNRLKCNKDILYISVILLCGFLLSIYFCSLKTSYYIDEYLTYAYSNCENFGAAFTDNDFVTEKAFTDTFAVTPQHRFDYKMVWRNQAADVHPPLYHTLIHTICSFMPGTFSKWQGLSVNIVFFLLMLFVSYKTVYILCKNKEIDFLICLFMALNPTLLHSATFIRMYMMCTFFIVFLTYLIICHINRNNDNLLFYISLILTISLGSLTHYYFIIFAFFICSFFGIYLICKRYFKTLIKCILSALTAAVISLIVFPHMIDHIFSGYRGEQTFSNLSNSNFMECINNYMKIVINDFGGFKSTKIILLFAMLLLLAAILIAIFKHNIKTYMLYFKNGLLLIILSGICYFMLVAKISPFTTERYIYPIYPLIILCIFVIIGQSIAYIFKRWPALIIYSILLISITTYGYKTHTMPNLYLNAKERINTAMQHEDDTCLYIYKATYRICDSYADIRHYNRILFMYTESGEEVKLDDRLKNEKSLIVYVDLDLDTEILRKQIIEQGSYFNKYTLLYSYGYVNVYYFE